MTMSSHNKVTASHLSRKAYLYVRQSSMQQVFENSESTERQYALKQRAVALGWQLEDIVVVDCDQGQSAASAVDRQGFQQLVAEVSLGRAGVVLGLEVSRLARNSSDWHRLLEICALGDTLIVDEDGIYSPCDFNDRLLLGLKGTMSEAELHMLRARLRGGLLNKARRGELAISLPVGLVYDSASRVVLDPDQQVQNSMRHLFQTFRRTGSASATVKAFRDQKLLFPRRPRSGPGKGELVWGALTHNRTRQVLHNPRYAGAFVFGRHGQHRSPDGRMRPTPLPREQWHTLLLDAHAGYIPWEQYEQNLKTLRDNACAHGRDRRQSPPREGPALLQGLVMCGVCGDRMTVRYHSRQGRQRPIYVCQRDRIEYAGRICQHIPGARIDDTIGELLLDTVTPTALEVVLTVQDELRRRIDEVDQLHHQRVERAQHEVELARRRFMQVDPDNRLAADALEADWNDKLRAYKESQERYEEQRKELRAELSDEQRAQIAAIATDFPALWRDPKTPHRERKRMVRLLIEDVTIIKRDAISVHVRFKGGATQTLSLPLPPSAWQMRQTPQQIVFKIDRLLDSHTDGQTASILNDRGHISGCGKPFNRAMVQKIRRKYNLKSRYQRLRKSGLLTLHEIAEELHVHEQTVKTWRDHGLLLAVPFNDKNECLYPNPGENAPVKQQGTKLSERRLPPEVLANRTEEVQCEA
ncbi:MAG: recombinase family protein [Deltaproteobacteria bacterium]|nr:recombinase family protein [Deltaproteobacteria bacterium]